jgi:hypothetical protein|tara:strand:- start:79 stop:468 length:390 start_codon:yes stop_codon:yes gene_type:complete
MPPKKRFSPTKRPIIRKRLICEPAMLYLLVAMMGLMVLGIQNLTHNDGSFCMGKYECNAVSKTTAFIIQLFYILFWTWILNTLCKYGYRNVSWVIVLIPFFLYVGIVSSLASSGVLYVVVEGNKNKRKL